MKHIPQRILLAGLSLMAGTALSAQTTLLQNADFSNGTARWIVSSNKFVGGAYVTTVGTWSGAYAATDFVSASGSGNVFASWDDETSDVIEHFLLQEFNAGPSGSTWPTIFQTGDVVVFKGSARSTRAGTDPSDVKVRAFLKTLGYVNNIEFQVKESLSDFYTVPATLGDFELTMTYPDISVDDSLQVIQIGFEITTTYDSGSKTMDTGTIYFENLEAYIEGDGSVDPGENIWRGYTKTDGWVFVEGSLGWIYVENEPWIFSQAMGISIYLPGFSPLEATEGTTGWVYIP